MIENGDKTTVQNSTKNVGWEREVIEKLALAAITEQRTARRWNVFFKALMFTYLLVIFMVSIAPQFKKSFGDSGAHTAVINIVGPILEDSASNAQNIIAGLHNALEDESTQGIILKMNTPGGSPVQSAYIFEEIRQIKKDNPDMPIYAVISDICASGGYYIAAAADKIFVNQSSIVGSIGVIMDGYGFVDTFNKLGIERRVMTSGTNKALLDPFSPLKEDEVKHAQALLDEVHQQFIAAVRLGRGERLKADANVFTGLIWTGAESINLGLADAIASVDSVAKDIIGAEDQVDFTPRERLLDRIASRVGASFGQQLSSFFNGVSMQLK